ncbi:MAG: hypothetical protein ABIR80_06155 [Opitutaceae bacterium]
MTGRDQYQDPNDVLADVARKWLGIRNLPRDRDLADSARHAVRITAFLLAADGRWDRGELVVGQPVDTHIVWQPFPQGAAVVLAGPFAITETSIPETTAGGLVREIILLTVGGRLELRLMVDDLSSLKASLASQARR